MHIYPYITICTNRPKLNGLFFAAFVNGNIFRKIKFEIIQEKGLLSLQTITA